MTQIGYFHGDKGIVTGVEIDGLHEIKMFEGHLKGELRLVARIYPVR